MSFYLTNNEYYIGQLETGKIFKTENIENASCFSTFGDANKVRKMASKKTKGYYIYDDTTGVLYKNKRRKKYSENVRRMIYKAAAGRCQLCGRKILYEEMTLDHIIPLGMLGVDSEENLQCACQTCNNLKGSILPEDFIDRITSIFIYQMDKKHRKNLAWLTARTIMKGVNR